MVTGVLFLMLVLWVLLLAAFIYRIVTTPLTAVDAPTLIKSAAAPSAADPAAPSPWPASALSSSRSSSPCASRAGIRTPPARAPGCRHHRQRCGPIPTRTVARRRANTAPLAVLPMRPRGESDTKPQ